MSRHRIAVIGSGFGGLFFTQALRRRDDVEITLIARTSHHLFQPLLYQVATGILSQGEIAPATREILARQANARVVMGEVTGIDVAARTVTSTFLDQETITPTTPSSSPPAPVSPTSATTTSPGTHPG